MSRRRRWLAQPGSWALFVSLSLRPSPLAGGLWRTRWRQFEPTGTEGGRHRPHFHLASEFRSPGRFFHAAARLLAGAAPTEVAGASSRRRYPPASPNVGGGVRL